MPKEYKVWIEVEEYNPAKDTYERVGEPLDLFCSTQKQAHKLQAALHSIGEDIQAHYGGAPKV